jgi:hypothetical protein
MSSAWTHLAVIAVWLVAALPAQAYLDGGSLSALFQAAGASIFTAWFVLKRYRASLRARLAARKASASPPPERPES